MVGPFNNETFNRDVVLKKAGQHMNIVWDQYRVHLERNPRHAIPSMIPAREWKSLVEYGKGMAMGKQGMLPLGTGRRYAILSTM